MAAPSPDESVADEKADMQHKEIIKTEVAQNAAERGHLATDQYGRPIVEFDKAAESRLRLKIDLCIVPTVALMYLFCFIDRANVGTCALKEAYLAGFIADRLMEKAMRNSPVSIRISDWLATTTTQCCRYFSSPTSSLKSRAMSIPLCSTRGEGFADGI